jgi:hypothetical protein
MRLTKILLRSLAATVAWAAALPALAIDGVVLIDQNKALSGSVTPGDAPGFPVTITAAGSYRLSGNLLLPNANATAIEVTAAAVTIDLNGFAITSWVNCTYTPNLRFSEVDCGLGGTGVGVYAAATSDTVVQNGTIRGMGLAAVWLGLDGVVQDLQVYSNAGGSAHDAGAIITQAGTVRRNNVRGNGGIGIEIKDRGLISDNFVVNNTIGIRTGGASLVTGNSVVFNMQYGLQCDADSLATAAPVGYSNNVISMNGINHAGPLNNSRFGSCLNLGQNNCDGRCVLSIPEL